LEFFGGDATVGSGQSATSHGARMDLPRLMQRNAKINQLVVQLFGSEIF
jgi:hypothetical protein